MSAPPAGMTSCTPDDAPGRIETGTLAVFASLDSAVDLTLRMRPAVADGAAALVIVQDWGGHDPALRAFTLLFAEHRLLALGFAAVRFADVAAGRTSEPDLADEVDIVTAILPRSAGTGASAAPRSAEAPLVLLIAAGDPDPRELVDAAQSAVARHGRRLVLVLESGIEAIPDLPPTLARLDAGRVSPDWVARRAASIAAIRFQGWRSAYAAAADMAGVPVVELGPGPATALLEAALTGETGTAPLPADRTPFEPWLRRIAAGIGGAASKGQAA
ncbi:MAG: hypothetical protein ACMVY4_04705 [Minwuia sp.]|uniref:hypothetical protein n=1 Tax=Minwuia sp. TaxID=2493630 RepID=UPI003A8A295B